MTPVQHAQSSDQTGEYYTTLARFVDGNGTVVIDLLDDWTVEDMESVAALLNRLRSA